MAALCLLLKVPALLQDFTLTERSELLELGWKLMLNIFVSALSNFFLLSGSKFQRKTTCKTTSLYCQSARKLATFVIILVATIFFHSPWRPKWSQLGALPVLLSVFNSLTHTVEHSYTCSIIIPLGSQC